MDDSRFLDFVDALCRRPGMYTGDRRFASAVTLLVGFELGVLNVAPDDPGLGTWRQWVEMRHDICHPAWSWARILLHHHMSDEEVFKVLPSLFRQYLADRNELGAAGLEGRHAAQFDNRWPEPESTHTVPPC